MRKIATLGAEREIAAPANCLGTGLPKQDFRRSIHGSRAAGQPGQTIRPESRPGGGPARRAAASGGAAGSSPLRGRSRGPCSAGCPASPRPDRPVRSGRAGRTRGTRRVRQNHRPAGSRAGTRAGRALRR